MLLLGQSGYKNIKSCLLLPMKIQVDGVFIQSKDSFSSHNQF